jgi:DNA-binding transcriptional LysR family regulator
MNLSLRQFEVFLAVARARSFRRAAETLHVSQPALSQHIRDLERELGVRLFDRSRRMVTLTEGGRLLEDHAHRLFATLTSIREVLGELAGLTRGSLVIGASTTPGIYVLPRVIAVFRARHPGIALTLQIANSRQIEERLRGNELDLGVVGGHDLPGREQCLEVGLPDELVLAVPPSHPWARRREIRADELAAAPLLTRESGSATRQATERALHQAGVEYRVVMELGHTEAIKQAVMAGLGVAFVSIHAIRGEVRARLLAAVRLRGLRIRRHFHVLHNDARTLGRAALEFVALLTAPAVKEAGSLATRGLRSVPGRRHR